MKKAVFIDRDGTLNEMVYNDTHGLLDSPRRPDQVRLIPGAAHFMREVRGWHWPVIVVTNQPGIAKGTLTLADLQAVNRRLTELLAVEGAGWDALYFCPHHPQGGTDGNREQARDCDCRKPKPGLLVRAAREHDLDLKSSWMVGDGLNDVQAGHAAGCRAILVSRLKLEQVERFFQMDNCLPDAIAADLPAALEIIHGG